MRILQRKQYWILLDAQHAAYVCSRRRQPTSGDHHTLPSVTDRCYTAGVAVSDMSTRVRAPRSDVRAMPSSSTRLHQDMIDAELSEEGVRMLLEILARPPRRIPKLVALLSHVHAEKNTDDNAGTNPDSTGDSPRRESSGPGLRLIGSSSLG